MNPPPNPQARTDSRADSPVAVGKITAPHGVRGWVKLRSDLRPPREIFRYAKWQLARGAKWRAVEVAQTRAHAHTLLAKLAGIDDRDAAAAIAGADIAVHKSELAKLPAGEYYWGDLIGMQVVNRDGVTLGRVDRLLETGANDVLAVRDAGRERLLPWGAGVVDAVDTAAARISVNWHADD